ncbi:uroporphyrinogen decarboxylase family protein [Acetobacterium wieringae]|uniref:uroporphyrinogen decarboxylase family protein n=1 Tax=Acetobacterium wieringae TaxID=52694 RepID=UPI002B212C45|nr:uroporphyrinogen decarboxylase family protein [Acetobacterium wieringae]MEA4805379.1 uroporphyrinogen decarboxylase family protein [Acetobacterium wieringae]
MSDAKGLLDERLIRIEKAVNLEKPDRIPIFALNSPEVAVDYCGRHLKTATWNLEILRECLPVYYQDMKVDAAFAAFLRCPGMYTIIESQNFVPNKDGFMQHPEVCGMLPSEYEELIKDPFKTLVEKVLPRQYKAFAKPGMLGGLNLAKGALSYLRHSQILKEIDAHCRDTVDIPIISDNMIEAPFDFLADQLRSFMGISVDMHRCPELVEQACEALLPLMLRWGVTSYSGPPKRIPAIFMPLHMPAFLSPQQFERFYWPTFSRLVNTLTGLGYTVALFIEGNWSKFFDHLASLPPHVVGIFEYGDMKTIKEKVGKNMCVMGNYPIEVLKSHSTAECIDIAKKMIDAGAPGGGYIFTTGKAIIRGKGLDLKKLQAVHQYVIDHGKY